MKNRHRSVWALFLLCFLWMADASAQNIVEETRAEVALLAKQKQKLPGEQLYIQTDKPYYAVGDTIWLKAYVLNSELAYTNKSGLVYLELVNDTNRVVKRLMLAAPNGIGWGSIALSKEDFDDGPYTLRCYTNWMRNFGEEHFYCKSLYIGEASADQWLINTAAVRKDQQINATLKLLKPDKQAVALQDLRVKVYNSRHEILSQKMMTTLDGLLHVNFPVPEQRADIRITAETMNAARKRIVIPLTLKDEQAIDLQFMPEGGTLMAGYPTRIGFKALNEDGLGADVSGQILDSQQKPVAAFTSAHKGMGSFILTPSPAESYTAVLNMAGLVKTFPLPPVQQSGTRLSVDNSPAGDSLVLRLNSSKDCAGGYMLLAEARQTICYAAAIQLNASASIRQLAKTAFPTGVVTFILLNSQGQPLNQRSIFVDHHDQLKISCTPSSKTYHPGDSVALQLRVTNKDGKPIQGAFSMAVTDDAQVAAQTDIRANILTTMLLNSGVRGNIEEPAYYLNTADEKAWKHLDLLLLTQAYAHWSPPRRDTTFDPEFIAEKEFTIHGKVLNAFNKPVAASPVVLLSSKPMFLRDTVTDIKGRFSFASLPVNDTIAYNLQARNKKGKSFNVGIEIEEFKEPLMPLYDRPAHPWYVNTDSTLISYIRNSVKRQTFNDKLPEGVKLLKEVHVKAKKIVPGSKNLYGPGEANQVFDQKDMEKAGKKTLLEILEQQVKGFHQGSVPHGMMQWYFIHTDPVFVVVDGWLLHSYYGRYSFEDYRSYLSSVSAEDLKGIEVIYNAAQYEFTYLKHPPSMQVTFIEITTRAGQGAIIKNTPGTYLYKPLQFASTRRFYAPKYPVKNPLLLSQDLRPTIHWEPDIITNTEGKATVSFYAAGHPGTYTCIIEGCDLNGSLGYMTGRIEVVK